MATRSSFLRTSRTEKLRHNLARQRHDLKVREAIAALEGIERMRPQMGDEWADGNIAYRKRQLRELGHDDEPPYASLIPSEPGERT